MTNAEINASIRNIFAEINKVSEAMGGKTVSIHKMTANEEHGESILISIHKEGERYNSLCAIPDDDTHIEGAPDYERYSTFDFFKAKEEYEDLMRWADEIIARNKENKDA